MTKQKKIKIVVCLFFLGFILIVTLPDETTAPEPESFPSITFDESNYPIICMKDYTRTQQQKMRDQQEAEEEFLAFFEKIVNVQDQQEAEEVPVEVKVYSFRQFGDAIMYEASVGGETKTHIITFQTPENLNLIKSAVQKECGATFREIEVEGVKLYHVVKQVTKFPLS